MKLPNDLSERVLRLSLLFTFVLAGLATAYAQSTVFTYQGHLNDGALAANGSYQMEFALFDAATGGNQIGSTLIFDGAGADPAAVAVANGIFTVPLDFGANAFDGNARYLEISVKRPADPTYVTLAPRQQFTSAPYAIRTLRAAAADTAINAQQLNGVTAGNYVQTNDARLSDARTPAPGSNNYVQNTSAQQASTNFNISGDGTTGGTLSGNTVNAVTHYELANTPVLSAPGPDNFFAGPHAGERNIADGNTFFGTSAGQMTVSGRANSFFGTGTGAANSTGSSNVFLGYRAGVATTTGGDNAFLGTDAGGSNLVGINNVFVGSSAGYANTASHNVFLGFRSGFGNTTGSSNNFLGDSAGIANTNGGSNTFLGSSAGFANTTGSFNSFLGTESGVANTAGIENVFLGVHAGLRNTTGNNNLFLGTATGTNNVTGSNNTLVGWNAEVSGNNLTNATAIGAGAIAGTSNSVVLGRSADTVLVPGDLNVTGNITGNLPNGSTNYIQNQNAVVQPSTNFSISGNGTAGGTLSANVMNSATEYDLGGARVLSAPGDGNFFAGPDIGQGSSPGSDNTLVGASSGIFATGSNNAFFGGSTGRQTTGDENAFFGVEAGRNNSTGGSNAFFGRRAGMFNDVGSNNVFFGASAGIESKADDNSFVGVEAGRSNIDGGLNTFIGRKAGFQNTSGTGNSFIGASTANSNLTGSNNTALGAAADFGSGNLSFATVIGAGATVSSNNTVTLGRPVDTVSIPGNLNLTGAFTGNISLPASNVTGVLPIANGGTGLSSPGTSGNFLRSNGSGLTSSPLTVSDLPAGSANYVQNTTAQQTATNFNISGDGTAGGTLSGNTVNSATQYNLGGTRLLSASGTNNLFIGSAAGLNNSTGTDNTFVGNGAGVANSANSENALFGSSAGQQNAADQNAFFGSEAGRFNSSGSRNSFFGRHAGFLNSTGSNNTALGNSADFGANNLTFATAVGAGATVSQSNTIALGRSSGLDAVQVFHLGAAGSTQLCVNAAHELSSCSSSLRYKTNIASFSPGLNLVQQLRPITFEWKVGGMKDVGFGAEDVAALDPRLVTYNQAGQVEGVKYDRLSVLFVNAFKEQQKQIAVQQKQNSELRTQLENQQRELAQQSALIQGLRKLVCAQNPTAELCQ